MSYSRSSSAIAKMIWNDARHALKEAWSLYRKGQLKLTQVPDFVIGTFRKVQFYFWKPWRMSTESTVLYMARLMSIKQQCFSNAACIECGCAVPGLNFVKRPCDGMCYPPNSSSMRKLLKKTKARLQKMPQTDNARKHRESLLLLTAHNLYTQSMISMENSGIEVVDYNQMYIFARNVAVALDILVNLEQDAHADWEEYIKVITRYARPEASVKVQLHI